MTTSRFGLALFWLGSAYIFGASWLAMWWIAPVWRHTPAAQFDGTAWAFGGTIFMTIALSVPVGIALVAVGLLLHAQAERSRILTFGVGSVLLAAVLLLFPTLGYYPVAFGILGGLIVLLFLAGLLYRARNRSGLDPSARAASDLQMAGYIMFFAAASTTCSALGNPFGGLYFPEKILQDGAMPWYYSMGTKIAVYFALGFLFSFLGQYLSYTSRSGRSSEA